ncbi:TPA: helix-hairpin-helix domain-containing protein [Pasteurella multocida]
MASSKKPRKKHNRNAVFLRASDNISKNSFILSVIKLGKHGQVWSINGTPQINGKISKVDYDLTFNVSRPWSFVFGVACRNILGQTFLRIEYVALSARHAFASDEIKNFVDSEINSIMKQAPIEHIVSPFFIASPEKREFTDDEINKLLNHCGTFERLKTPHEVEIIRNKGMDELRKIDPTEFTSKATWSILRKQGIETFAELRLMGLNAISKLKGIGQKRCDELINGYRELLIKYNKQDCIKHLEEFEIQIHLFQEATRNLFIKDPA